MIRNKSMMKISEQKPKKQERQNTWKKRKMIKTI